MLKVTLNYSNSISGHSLEDAVEYKYELELLVWNGEFHTLGSSSNRNIIASAHRGYFSSSIQSNQTSEQEVTSVLTRLRHNSSVTAKAMSVTFQNSYIESKQVKFYLIYYTDSAGEKLAVHMTHNLTRGTQSGSIADAHAVFNMKVLITNQV